MDRLSLWPQAAANLVCACVHVCAYVNEQVPNMNTYTESEL